MGKRLTDNVNSNYFSAANSLRPKNARRRIVAYVESYDDILFWRTLLSLYEDGTRYFEVMLPSHRTLERGKRSALMSLLYGKTGADMLACVDADYDYLMQGASETSREIISNPAILHTYAYSIENLQCYAPSLHNVCVMVTLNDRKVFDLQNFMTRFSEIIFPLFVWSIWHYRRGVYGQFTISDFNRTIELGGFNINRPQDALDNLRSKVMRKVNYMNRQHPEAEQEYKELSAELVRLGVEPEQTYLYIQGHHLFDNDCDACDEQGMRHVDTRTRSRDTPASRAYHADVQRTVVLCALCPGHYADVEEEQRLHHVAPVRADAPRCGKVFGN